jgi:tetratricopeptide (TPR) repeat protein
VGNNTTILWIILLFLNSSVLGQNANTQDLTNSQENINHLPREDSLSLAEAYIKKGITQSLVYQNYEEGIESFSKAITIDPNNSLTYYNRGYSFMKLEDFTAAILDFKRSIELDSSNKKTFINLGRCYTNLKDQEIAINVYKKGLEIDSSYAALHYNMGLSYSLSGELNKALNAYNKAILYNNEKSNYYFNRGMIFQQLNDGNNALSDYKMARNLNPKNTDVYIAEGFVYLNQNKKTEAIKAYSKAISIDSTLWSAYFNRGLIYLEDLEFGPASQDLILYTEHNQNDAFGFFYAAKAQMELGNNYEAMGLFQSSVNLNPDFGWSNYYLGYIMINSFGKFEGCTYLEKAMNHGIEEAERTYYIACISK